MRPPSVNLTADNAQPNKNNLSFIGFQEFRMFRRPVWPHYLDKVLTLGQARNINTIALDTAL